MEEYLSPFPANKSKPQPQPQTFSSEPFVNFLPLEDSPDSLPGLNGSFFSLSSYRSSLYNSSMASYSTFNDFSTSFTADSPPPSISSFPTSRMTLNAGSPTKGPMKRSFSSTESASSPTTTLSYSPTSDISSIRTPQSHMNLSRALLPRDVSFMDVFAPRILPPSSKSEFYFPPTPSTPGDPSPTSILSYPRSHLSTPSISPQPHIPAKRGFQLPMFNIAAPTPELDRSPTPRFPSREAPSLGSLSPAFIPMVNNSSSSIKSQAKKSSGKRTFGMRRLSSQGMEETVKVETKEDQSLKATRSNSEPSLAPSLFKKQELTLEPEVNAVQPQSRRRSSGGDSSSSLSSSSPSTPRRPSKSSLRPRSICRTSSDSNLEDLKLGGSKGLPLLGSPIALTGKVGVSQVLEVSGRIDGSGQVKSTPSPSTISIQPLGLVGIRSLNESSTKQSPIFHPPRNSSLKSATSGTKRTASDLELSPFHDNKSYTEFGGSSASEASLSPTNMTFEDSMSLRAQAETRAKILQVLEEKARNPSAFSPESLSSGSIYSRPSIPYTSPSIASPSEEQQLALQLQRYRIINQSLGTSSKRSSRSSLLPPPKPRPNVALPPIPNSTSSVLLSPASRVSSSAWSQDSPFKSESLSHLALLAAAQLDLIEASRALEKQRRNSQVHSPSDTKGVKDLPDPPLVLEEGTPSRSSFNRPRSCTIDQLTRRCFEPPSSPPAKEATPSEEVIGQSPGNQTSKRNSLLREILLDGGRSSWWRSDLETLGKPSEEIALHTPQQKRSHSVSSSQALHTPSFSSTSPPPVRNLHSSPSLQALMDYQLPSRLPAFSIAASASASKLNLPTSQNPQLHSTTKVDSRSLNQVTPEVERMDEDLKSVHASCGSSTGSQFLRLFKGNNKKRKMNENLPASTNNYTGTSRATAPIPDEIQIITRPSIVESNPDPDEALSPEIRSSTTEGASSEVIGLFPSSPSGTTTPMLDPLFFMDGLSEKRASTSSITETSSTHDTLAATRTPRPNEDSSAWEQPSSSKVTIEDAEKEVLMDEKATASIPLQAPSLTLSSRTFVSHHPGQPPSSHAQARSPCRTEPAPTKSSRSRKRSAHASNQREPPLTTLSGPFAYQDMLQMSQVLLAKGDERRERDQIELEEQRQRKTSKSSSGGKSKKSTYSLLSKASKKTLHSTAVSSESRNSITIGNGEERIELELESPKRRRSSKEKKTKLSRKKSNLSEERKSVSKSDRSRSSTSGADDWKNEISRKEVPPLPPMPSAIILQASAAASILIPDLERLSLANVGALGLSLGNEEAKEIKSEGSKSFELRQEFEQSSPTSSGRTFYGTPPELSRPFWDSSELKRDPLPEFYPPSLQLASPEREIKSRGALAERRKLDPLQINSINFPKSWPASPPLILGEDTFQDQSLSGEDFVSAKGSVDGGEEQRERTSFALMALRALALGDGSDEEEIPRMESSRDLESSPESILLCLTP